ncbi:hypothetical protein BT69DRAFT_1325606 [Atractiella rhizophila]|nr:hypothetical protein BT69DRAFT_1325606 [Atractiella rhizophila]
MIPLPLFLFLVLFERTTSLPLLGGDHYTLLPSNEELMLDPGSPENTPRQRTEFLFPYADDGDTRNYEWTTWISSETGSSDHFFHLFQLFSHGDDGPIITLDYYEGVIEIVDNYRSCSGMCPRVNASVFTDNAIRHEITVTYGRDGNFVYTARAKDTGTIVLQYHAPGYMGAERQTIKTGMYRIVQPDQTLARGFWGDFVMS